jgi:hypothetical protein
MNPIKGILTILVSTHSTAVWTLEILQQQDVKKVLACFIEAECNFQIKFLLLIKDVLSLSYTGLDTNFKNSIDEVKLIETKAEKSVS